MKAIMEKANKKSKNVGSQRRFIKRSRKVPRPSSLFSGAYRTIIRVMWDVGTGINTDGSSYTAPIDVGYIVPTGHAGLSTLFKSVRVHSMFAKFYPAIVKMSQYGFVAMNFGDVDENPISSTIPGILASPGNSIALAGSVVKGKWYPTEPSDKDYIDMVNAKSHTWARINLAIWPPKETEWFTAKAAVSHLYGKIIVDVDCTFRGQGSTLHSNVAGRCSCDKCRGRLIFDHKQRRHVVINGVLEEVIPYSTSTDDPSQPLTNVMVESPSGEDFENLDISSN